MCQVREYISKFSNIPFNFIKREHRITIRHCPLVMSDMSTAFNECSTSAGDIVNATVLTDLVSRSTIQIDELFLSPLTPLFSLNSEGWQGLEVVHFDGHEIRCKTMCQSWCRLVTLDFFLSLMHLNYCYLIRDLKKGFVSKNSSIYLFVGSGCYNFCYK